MKSLEELRKLREESLHRVDLRKSDNNTRILVAMGTCGIAAGARPVLMALVEEVKKQNLQDVAVMQTGSTESCDLAPMFEVSRKGEEKVTYVHMDAEKAKKVIEEHIIKGNIIEEYTMDKQEK